ncbi:MAG: hypothetical protein Q9216_003390 [Gyalolechia sp. 2 TL-2023]
MLTVSQARSGRPTRLNQHLVLESKLGSMVLGPLSNIPPIPSDLSIARRRFIAAPGFTPWEQFPIGLSHGLVPHLRYIRLDNPREALVFIAGVCHAHGTPKAQAGYGIDWGPEDQEFARLLGLGPPNAHRAELMAAIVALSVFDWLAEGFNTLVIASDSGFVAQGICKGVCLWLLNDFKNLNGLPVAFREYWETLVAKLGHWNRRGLLVRFWEMPMLWNGTANTLAIDGARGKPSGGSGFHRLRAGRGCANMHNSRS